MPERVRDAAAAPAGYGLRADERLPDLRTARHVHGCARQDARRTGRPGQGQQARSKR